MRLLHAAARTRAVFDEPNLIAHAGLVPVLRLAGTCGLEDLAGEQVRAAAKTGANAGAKITAIVAGMAAGADSIDGLGVLRHGAMSRVFGGIRAPSTLGSFLRGLTYGNACQAEAVSRRMLARLARKAPVLPGADALAVIDIDSVQRQVHGPAKQGAGFGHAKVAGYDLLVRGLNALIATVSTAHSVSPVIACTRLRGGNAGSSRGSARFAAEAITTARAAGCGGQLHMRGDSAFYTKKTIRACRKAGVRFSFTVKMDPAVKRAIASISEDQWISIKYPQAVWDEDEKRWISDAQIAEVSHTAFASGKAHAVTARLIVRRVKRLNPRASAGQGELFELWRHHAFFTDNPMILHQAEAFHRGHAIIEQVNADLIDGPLNHMPSGSFAANAAWLACAAIAHNLIHAAGALASPFHAAARASTIRRDLITVPARIARTGHADITCHLPAAWPAEHAFTAMFDRVHAPPEPAAA
jgi:hypothetical protein